jgi:hypothetical protein
MANFYFDVPITRNRSDPITTVLCGSWPFKSPAFIYHHFATCGRFASFPYSIPTFFFESGFKSNFFTGTNGLIDRNHEKFTFTISSQTLFQRSNVLSFQATTPTNPK